MIALWATVLTMLMLAALACFKQSRWYRHESRFWREIAIFSRLGMAPADAPALLAWSHAHKPGFWRRLGPWRAPQERRRRAGDSP